MAATSTTFQKGDGRRKGRPKGAKNKKTLEIEDLAREHAPAAMEKLVALVGNPKHPAHFSAIKEILDRGYGKPKQAIEHTGKDGEPVQVQHSAADEILRRLDAIAARKG